MKHRNTQNRSKSTNHKSETMTFWTHWSELLFPKTSTEMIDGSEKCKHQLTFELQNLRVYESAVKREKQKNNVWYFLFLFVVRYTPSPQLELSGPADFGVTVADGKVLRQEIFVLNEGSLPGEFKIRYTGNEPITIIPSGGIVRPGAKQGVKVNKNCTVSCMRLFLSLLTYM